MSAAIEPITGRYVHLSVDGATHRIYFEEAGSGIPLLCLHTAGAHSSQYRHLMCDPDVTGRFRVIAFDHHPITLAVLQPLVIAAGATAVQLATGSGTQGKKGVGKALDRDATDPAVALCSDPLN